MPSVQYEQKVNDGNIAKVWVIYTYNTFITLEQKKKKKKKLICELTNFLHAISWRLMSYWTIKSYQIVIVNWWFGVEGENGRHISRNIPYLLVRPSYASLKVYVMEITRPIVQLRSWSGLGWHGWFSGGFRNDILNYPMLHSNVIIKCTYS